MDCQDVIDALADFTKCEATSDGCRVQTHCLYPSFDSVFVYVTKLGDTFRISDNAEAFSSAWAHGRNDSAISRSIEDECRRNHIVCENGAIVARADNPDWLATAILTVANASANAALSAVAKSATASEEVLSDRIGQSLYQRYGLSAVSRHHEEKGNSGGVRRFDFIVRGPRESTLLINAVTPHPNSVNSKYVDFADTVLTREWKLAVFDRQLPADAKSLLGQVSTTLPLASLLQGAERALAHAV